MYTKFVIIAIVCIQVLPMCFTSSINIEYFRKFENRTENPILSAHSDYFDFPPDDYGLQMNRLHSYTHLISGGYRPERHMFAKYMVSIRTAKPTEYFGDNHLCSGTIVASTLILTAAHCVMDLNKVVTRPDRLMVVAGTPNRLKRAKSTVEFEVFAVIPHPEFKPKGEHDIAILRLKHSIPHDNDNIKILPMIKVQLTEEANCTTVGWGQLFLNGPYAAEVVYLDQRIVDAKSCKEFLGAAYSYDVICGVSMQGKYGEVCRGDSGGPLICNRNLAGLIRWGPPCISPYPSAYTAVSEYLDWINSVNVAYVVKPAHRILYLIFFITLYQFYIW